MAKVLVPVMQPLKILETGGRQFSSKKIYPVLDPEPAPIHIHTLTGLLAASKTITDWTTCLVHVEDFDHVKIVSNLYGENKQRDTFAVATSYPVTHKFGAHMPVDEFIVYLQSCFVQDETTADIMRIVGNLTQGAEAQFADDGVTQRVTAKAGITRVEVVDLPNPVTLRPFRTFSDIEQPASKFVLRIKADKDSGPRCALFEADGGAWKTTAISSIRDWFIANDGPVCIA